MIANCYEKIPARPAPGAEHPLEEPMDRIRVMHLIQGLEIGGVEKMVVDLITHMDQSRFEPSVCCYDSLGPLLEPLENQGIPVYLERRLSGRDWSYPWRLARLLRRERIQVIHMHNPTALDYGAPAAAIARVPLRIYTEHGRDFSTSRKEIWIERVASSLLDHCVILHDRAFAFIRGRLHIPASKVVKIYNGISWPTQDGAEEDRVAWRVAHGFPPERKVIAVIGRLAEVKHPLLALEAARILFSVDQNPVLAFVGDGPLRPALERSCRDWGLADRVFFLGMRNDVSRVLNAVDLVWSPSRSEGLSLSLIEACAAGVPVVCTDVGGNAEVVEPGVSGLLVQPDDARSLAEATAKILRQPDLLKRMGRAGVERFQRYFSLEQMVHMYQALYTGRPRARPLE